MSRGISSREQIERHVLQRKRAGDGFVLPRSQRLMQRVYIDSMETELGKTFDTTTIRSGFALVQSGAVVGVDKTGARGNYVGHIIDETGTHFYARLELRPRVQGVGIDGSCTCTAHRRCAHLAAAACAALAPSLKRSNQTQREPSDMRPALRDWIRAIDPAQEERKRRASNKIIVYLLHAGRGELHTLISVATAQVFADGTLGVPQIYDAFHLSNNGASYVSLRDQGIGFELAKLGFGAEFSLEQRAAAYDDLLERILATGHAFFESANDPPLRAGPPRAAQLIWHTHTDGSRELTVEPIGFEAAVMTTLSPRYITADGTCGPLVIDCAIKDIYAAVSLPKLAPAELPIAQEAIVRRKNELRLPAIDGVAIEHHTLVPERHLALQRSAQSHGRISLMGELVFRYDGDTVACSDPRTEFRRVSDGVLHLTARAREYEQAARDRLESLGFRPLGDLAFGLPLLALPSLTLPHESVAAFLHGGLSALREDGWIVELADDIDTSVVDAGGTWQIDTHETAPHWFSVDVAIEHAGERIALLPLILDLLDRATHVNPIEVLRRRAQGDKVLVTLPNGGTAALPLERLERLVELIYDVQAPHRANETVRVSLPQLVEFAQESEARIAFSDGRLHDFFQVLAAGNFPLPELPSGFTAELRPYQREGTAWMQLLARHGIGGILADEMGLGKTVQTLAHLALEQSAHRLDAPALIVVPASLVPNWLSEAARFAPGLRMHAANGHAHATTFDVIAARDCDCIVTTYTMLERDHRFQDVGWSSVILDEAQYIKNPRSKTARAARALNAKHRLCLTGTPVQNDLRELWALFMFLNPGMLGDEQRFYTTFRIPIEQHGSITQRDALRRLVAPFVLRRKKETVATELPPKIDILTRVELGTEQRDYYESIRIAMHDQVRRRIAADGVERSKAVILNALLKLRQVCCDPRLVKMGRPCTQSAKLEALLEIVTTLRREQRQVLIFSQFTAMLAIIADALAARDITYEILTGDSVDRRTPVERFQNNEVGVFLLSLRAGGTGLNLTAADAVIHYDQWWNPSVELQATDRAHRIGREHPVFVYRLVVAGSVEERMLELHEKKRILTDGVLESDTASSTDELYDLEQIFRPLA